MKNNITKLSLFIFSGICSNGANIVSFYFLQTIINLTIYVSGTIAYFVGLLVGFYLNSNYTFKVKKSFQRKFFTYLMIQLGIYCLYALYNIYFISLYSSYSLILHILGVLICAIMNFALLNLVWSSNEGS